MTESKPGISAPGTKLLFMDTETTGLSRYQHEVWEIAYVLANHTPQGLEILKRQLYWIKPRNMQTADPMALKINGFYSRWTGEHSWDDPEEAALQIARDSVGTHLIGAVPDFDAHFVSMFMLQNSYHPGWHYHLIDIETLIAGRLHLTPPYKSENLFEQLGLSRDYPNKHTAMGDVNQLIACWNALYFSNKDNS